MGHPLYSFSQILDGRPAHSRAILDRCVTCLFIHSGVSLFPCATLTTACSLVFLQMFFSIATLKKMLSESSDSFCRFPLFQCLCPAEASLFAPRRLFSRSFRISRVSHATDSAFFLSWDCIMLLLLGLYSPPSSSLTTRNNLSSLLQAYPPDTCSQEPPSRLNVINIQRACAALAKLRCLRNGHCAPISCHWHVSKTGNHAQCASNRRVPRPHVHSPTTANLIAKLMNQSTHGNTNPNQTGR